MTNNNFLKELLKKIDEDREGVIQEKEELERMRNLAYSQEVIPEKYRNPKPTGKIISMSDEKIIIEIEGVNFIFDEEGYKYFRERLDNIFFKILVTEEVNSKGEINYYLAYKIAEKGKEINHPNYFHRQFMKDEIEEFTENNRHGRYNFILVHHVNMNSQDNRKKNLQVMTRVQHDYIHYRR